MFDFLNNLFNASKTPASRPAPIRRRASIGVEMLEGRALPSVTPLVGPSLLAQVPHKAINVNPVVDVANVSGYTFVLNSSIPNTPVHTLVIQTETFKSDGSATFTGTWSGNGSPSNTPHPIVNGTIKYDASGNMIMAFEWGNGQNTYNSFSGTLSKVTNPPAATSIYGTRYSLAGNVMTPPGSGPGPGYVSGYGSAPLLIAPIY